MSIRKADVVDWLGIEKGTGDIIVSVVDDEDWENEEEHLALLQGKLNRYLAFIESGEVYERLTSDVGRTVSRATPIRVSILARHPLPSRAHDFLEYAEKMFRGAGFSLAHKVLPVLPTSG